MAAVRVRIEHKGEQRFVSTDLKVQPQRWRDGKVTKGHPDAATINEALARIQSEVQSALTGLRTGKLTITADRVKAAVENALSPEEDQVGAEGFVDYSRERIRAEYEKQSTRRNHLASIRKFQRFLGETGRGADVPISPSHLTPALLEEYMAWEAEEMGNAQNTIHKSMRTIRRMVNLAIRDGLFPRSEYPFEHITLSRKRTEKTPLHAGQIEALEQLCERLDEGITSYPKPDTVAAHALRAWLFALYQLGMRWSDVCSLEWANIRGGRVRYEMRKTGASKDLKLVPKASNILDVYRERKGEKRWVFPFLDRYEGYSDYDLTTNNGLTSAITSCNRRVNQKLKDVAEAAGIDVGLRTHLARHSAAERMMQAGWTLQEINAALGHESIATTEQYLRSVRDEELDDKHEGLF